MAMMECRIVANWYQIRQKNVCTVEWFRDKKDTVRNVV